MAQDRYILPVLGTDLYNKLISDVNNDTLTGNYLTLLQTYIQPALVQFSYAVILPFLRLRMVNNAVVTMSSEQGGSVSHEDLKPLINSAMDMGEFYRERLIDYIRNNTGLFPEYSSNTGSDLNPTTQNYYAGLNLDVAPTSNKIKSFLQGANITIFDC